MVNRKKYKISLKGYAPRLALTIAGRNMGQENVFSKLAEI